MDFEDSISGLSDRLTFSGIEVETIAQVGFDPDAYSDEDLDRIVVAEIRDIQPHPGADRLTLCTVNDGNADTVVVCGAPNVRVGMKTLYAPVGVTLANGLKLKKAKIRGVESLGMLCAEDELGISDDHEGIIDLPEGIGPGTPIRQVYTEAPELVLEVEITPNRPDCLSVMGVAREVAALYGSALKVPDVDFPENGEPVESLSSVEVLDTERCPRYTARVLTGVQIGESPEWMQRRLNLAGVRPINNAVDITNYVMLECGQPLHAFDYSRLKGHRIIVRNAAEGETMDTLDGQARTFTPDHLMIADAERAVAVAGVMGGADSEIRESTETLLLESAMFDPGNVRATAQHLDMNTGSSYRFARGCDIGGVDWSSRRAAALLVEHAGATAAQGAIDVYAKPVESGSLSCRYEKIYQLMGVQADADAVQQRHVEIRQGRPVLVFDVPPTLQAGRGAAGDQNREVHVVVQTRVAHPASVQEHGVVEQRALAVRRGLQLPEEIGEQRHMERADLGDLLDLHRIVAVMAGRMVRLRDANLGISTVAELARKLEGADPCDIGLERQQLQVEHERGVIGEPRRYANRTIEIASLQVLLGRCLRKLDLTLDLSHAVEVLVDAGAVAHSYQPLETRDVLVERIEEAGATPECCATLGLASALAE